MFFRIYEDFIKNCNNESDKGYYLDIIYDIHYDLPFLPERIKIEKVETWLLIYIEKINRVIKFFQNAWLKPYIDMNTAQKKAYKKYFFKVDGQ